MMERTGTPTPPIKERAPTMTTNEEDRQRDGPQRTLIDGPPPHYACSFCGRDREEVAHLIAGPNSVSICNECVERCNELLAEDEAPAET